MFSPYHLPFLIKYFDGIDKVIATRMLRIVPPSEPTLTEEFCALMSPANQRREGALAFDADHLQAALTSHGDLIDADFTIETHQHSQRMEAYVSQADFALVLEVENTILPSESWRAAYLMQAKRLFPASVGHYDVGSKFASTSKSQEKRIRSLARILGENALRYCLYCPPVSGYEPQTLGAIRALHMRAFSSMIFDYPVGLALHEEIRRSGGIDAGIWVAATKSPPVTAADLHDQAFRSYDVTVFRDAAAVRSDVALQGASPLTWFILHHLDLGTSRSGLVQNSTRTMSAKSVDRVRAIGSGDPKAAQDLIDELGSEARSADFDPESMKVLPANIVTIRLRVGPTDGLQLPLSGSRV
jgi:hypothetical protein